MSPVTLPPAPMVKAPVEVTVPSIFPSSNIALLKVTSPLMETSLDNRLGAAGSRVPLEIGAGVGAVLGLTANMFIKRWSICLG
jgi:hypothetical protein